jgi:pimeloyl-ACP methyl ester carboxylesterase
VLDEDRPYMDALFPTTRLIRIKNAGHWVHSEQPGIFLEALRRFLDGVEKRS